MEKKELFVNVEKRQVFMRTFTYEYNQEDRTYNLASPGKEAREKFIKGGWTPICFVHGWNTVLWEGEYEVVDSRTVLKSLT